MLVSWEDIRPEAGEFRCWIGWAKLVNPWDLFSISHWGSLGKCCWDASLQKEPASGWWDVSSQEEVENGRFWWVFDVGFRVAFMVFSREKIPRKGCTLLAVYAFRPRQGWSNVESKRKIGVRHDLLYGFPQMTPMLMHILLGVGLTWAQRRWAPRGCRSRVLLTCLSPKCRSGCRSTNIFPENHQLSGMMQMSGISSHIHMPGWHLVLWYDNSILHSQVDISSFGITTQFVTARSASHCLVWWHLILWLLGPEVQLGQLVRYHQSIFYRFKKLKNHKNPSSIPP